MRWAGAAPQPPFFFFLNAPAPPESPPFPPPPPLPFCAPPRHDLRERRGADHPHRGAPFEVRRYEQGHAGAPLQRVQLGGDLERRPDGDDQTAHLEGGDPPRCDLGNRIAERGGNSPEGGRPTR